MRKKRISIALWVVILLVFASPMIGSTRASPQTVMEVYPETTSVKLGETFTVYINIVDVIDLAGYEFKLGFSPYILEVVDITNGTFLGDIGFTSFSGGVWTGQPTYDPRIGYDADVVQDGILDVYDFCYMINVWGSNDPQADLNHDGVVNIVDGLILMETWGYTDVDIPGSLHVIQYHGGPPHPQSGSGSLATITFTAKDLGQTTLHLYDTKLSLNSGTPIPHEAIDGTVIVSLPPPPEATQYLITTVESYNLPGGIENGLTSKLEAAIGLFNQGNLVGAVHKLQDFIKMVEAQRDKRLTNEQADYLVAIAQAIINSVG